MEMQYCPIFLGWKHHASLAQYSSMQYMLSNNDSLMRGYYDLVNMEHGGMSAAINRRMH